MFSMFSLKLKKNIYIQHPIKAYLNWLPEKNNIFPVIKIGSEALNSSINSYSLVVKTLHITEQPFSVINVRNCELP